ncbi:MAG: Gx transporter family protein [Ruminococcaceae bacterium]|nr:Gx transporter family protein [Oscillospiraceae bacterium]
MGNVKINRRLIYVARGSLLAAVAVVLSILESFIPDIPFVLPGMKLGLGNLAVLLAVEICPLPMVIYIACVRALFSLVTRGATAFLMSFAGAILSSLVMYLLAQNKSLHFGCLGIGVAGAFTHNLGQLMVAFFVVGEAVAGYFPVLVLFSVVTGAITSLVHYFTLPAITRISIFRH